MTRDGSRSGSEIVEEDLGPRWGSGRLCGVEESARRLGLVRRDRARRPTRLQWYTGAGEARTTVRPGRSGAEPGQSALWDCPTSGTVRLELSPIEG